MKNTQDKQLTDQGEKTIKVFFKDKLSDATWTKKVTRSFLAKMYHEQRVVGAINGVVVIEI